MAFVNLKPTDDEPVYEGDWVAQATPEQLVNDFKTWDPEICRLLKVSYLYTDICGMH